ncbi:hypothetical protein [Salinactinospora qingdaonensis]|uniref:Uncharacterized protein n=1 Tax=Salinactinospora qingdaonensis TaxID=702744 RepID=A0ABP7FE82_9ACTN
MRFVSSSRRPRRAVTTMLAAAAAILAVPTPAMAAHPDIQQPFRAGHADSCLRSVTEGTLTWRATHPPEQPVVEVDGTLALTNPGACQFFVAPTAVASFTAYRQERVIDTESRATTGADSFSFTLTPDAWSDWSASIDRVVVQVCHGSVVSAPSDFGPASNSAANCGEPVTYTR